VDETSRRLRSATALGMSSVGPTGISSCRVRLLGPEWAEGPQCSGIGSICEQTATTRGFGAVSRATSGENIGQAYYSEISSRYEDLRPLDVDAVSLMSRYRPPWPLHGVEVCCGTGRYCGGSHRASPREQ